MRIIDDVNCYGAQGSAVAMGKFDGVHLGHRLLLKRMVDEARRRCLVPVVFTFNPPPAVLFGKERLAPLLSRDEQIRAFEELGIEVMVEFPFTHEAAATPPHDFVRQVLSKALKARIIACGDDVSFGRGGSGSLHTLRELAHECRYGVLVIDKLEVNGLPISSTRIREAMRDGRTDEAMAMMGCC